MYAMLWRALPGGRLAKTLQCLVLAGLVVTALFLWVFPVVASRLPYEQVTIEPTGSAAATQPAALTALEQTAAVQRPVVRGEQPA